jgi:hypothetical protein
MSGLLDIAPQRTRVEVCGHEIFVAGLSMVAIADLLRRFPDVRAAFGSGAGMGADDLFAILRDAIPPIIAAGCGHVGDDEYEARAAELSAEAQLELFGAILRLTMPEGAGPFAERVSGALGSLLSGPPAPAASSGNSPGE